jgi:hypothetical protein
VGDAMETSRQRSCSSVWFDMSISTESMRQLRASDRSAVAPLEAFGEKGECFCVSCARSRGVTVGVDRSSTTSLSGDVDVTVEVVVVVIVVFAVVAAEIGVLVVEEVEVEEEAEATSAAMPLSSVPRSDDVPEFRFALASALPLSAAITVADEEDEEKGVVKLGSRMAGVPVAVAFAVTATGPAASEPDRDREETG